MKRSVKKFMQGMAVGAGTGVLGTALVARGITNRVMGAGRKPVDDYSKEYRENTLDDIDSSLIATTVAAGVKPYGSRRYD